MEKKNKLSLFLLVLVILLSALVIYLFNRIDILEKRVYEQEKTINNCNSFINQYKPLILDLDKEHRNSLINPETSTTISTNTNTSANTNANTSPSISTNRNTIKTNNKDLYVIRNTANTDLSVNSNNTNTVKHVDPKELINTGVDKLDSKYFVTNPKEYNPDYSNKTKMNKSDSRIKTIAEIGFKESASRIASEGTENKESETITEEILSPNNYFTRKYTEYDKVYTDIKVDCFVVTRTNEMGCGVSIYIDAINGMIIGAKAFGD